MILPELPKLHRKREADFSIKFREWIMKNPKRTCTFEMKDTRGKSYLPYSEIKDTQINYGMQIKYAKTGVLIRIEGVNGEPDYGYFFQELAYIVVKFPRSFEIIDIEIISIEKKMSKRKSLTSKRAKEISVLSI